MQTELAAELWVMPTILRRWQRKLEDASTVPASPAAKPPVSAMASPADQASELARLRRELDRARMERDILKKPNKVHLFQVPPPIDTRLSEDAVAGVPRGLTRTGPSGYGA